MTIFSNDYVGAPSLIVPDFEQANPIHTQHAEVDPEMKRVHDHPRLKAMVAAATARLEIADGSEVVRTRGA